MGKILSKEISVNEVYLLCMMFGNETQILGIFTKEQTLLEAYERLINEDGQCLDTYAGGRKQIPQKPLIYQIPMNKFLGKKEQWCSENEYIFLENIEDCLSDVEKIRRKIAIFYGFEVYCDFDDKSKAHFLISYDGEQESYQGEIDMEQEKIKGKFPKCMQPVLQEWYQDNKERLYKIWKTGKAERLPDWEE